MFLSNHLEENRDQTRSIGNKDVYAAIYKNISFKKKTIYLHHRLILFLKQLLEGVASGHIMKTIFL